MKSIIPTVNVDTAKLYTRCYVAVLMLFHGTNKIIHGIIPIMGLLAKSGLPLWFAYGVYVGEIVAPLMLIAGIWSRIGAALIIVNLLFCIGLGHSDAFFKLSPVGGWVLEEDMLYIFPCLLIILIGGGRYVLIPVGKTK
jgi:putative oxidoreductase